LKESHWIAVPAVEVLRKNMAMIPPMDVPLGYTATDWEHPSERILEKMPSAVRAEMENAFFHVYRQNGNCDTYGVFGGGSMGIIKFLAY
jgi:hypothetical protein